jgi:hypothetical protein
MKSLLFDPVADVVELVEDDVKLVEPRLMFLLQILELLVAVSLQADTLYLHMALLFHEG